MSNALHKSKTGELCWARTGEKTDRHECHSHLEHVERWLPHVCCCGFEWDDSKTYPYEDKR